LHRRRRPPPPGRPSAPAPDRTPARLSSRARSARLTKAGAIAFVVTASEDATGAAAGAIRLAGTTVRFAKRRVTLRAQRPTKVTLRLARAGAALVSRALARHATVKARIALSLADAAGNTSATQLALRLRR
jgi:hypothetical protein